MSIDNNNCSDEANDRKHKKDVGRRQFLDWCFKAVPAGITLFTFGLSSKRSSGEDTKTSNNGKAPNSEVSYAMAVDIKKCIGCGRCAAACKKENKVPDSPYYVRTWVERYVIPKKGEPMIDSPNAGIDGFPDQPENGDVLKTFFVPKLCNHCDNPPCVQVCPVGATFKSPDGVVLVDDSYCVGCRYCIQACPYGARYIHPEKRVADKCTFCYHRISKGLAPACVEVCPTQARVFGDLKKLSSPIHRILQFNAIKTLKPELNTRPKVFYANADQEVR
ncbi:MAG: 4Fe-4S dicluster domain-containing protein [Bdellovibrionota bacterium]